jgi:hypothetical protein
VLDKLSLMGRVRRRWAWLRDSVERYEAAAQGPEADLIAAARDLSGLPISERSDHGGIAMSTEAARAFLRDRTEAVRDALHQFEHCLDRAKGFDDLADILRRFPRGRSQATGLDTDRAGRELLGTAVWQAAEVLRSRESRDADRMEVVAALVIALRRGPRSAAPLRPELPGVVAELERAIESADIQRVLTRATKGGAVYAAAELVSLLLSGDPSPRTAHEAYLDARRRGHARGSLAHPKK